MKTDRMLELVAQARRCVEDIVIPVPDLDGGATELLFAAEKLLDELEELLREEHFAPRRAGVG